MCQFAQHSARWCMQTIGAKVLSTRICLVSVYASSLARADSRCREDANVDASCMKRGRLSPKGRKRRGIRARRVRGAKKTTSRAALLRAADTRRTALGLAAVDAVPVLGGHGPQVVAIDVTRLLAQSTGSSMGRPREALEDGFFVLLRVVVRAAERVGGAGACAGCQRVTGRRGSRRFEYGPLFKLCFQSVSRGA